MANKLFFLIFLQFICGLLCQEGRNNYLKYPVDCVGNEVYPWFDGCSKYLQCNNAGEAALLDCPPTQNDKLKIVCPLDNSPSPSCGYTCATTTTDMIQFVAHNANITATSYYAMCIKGVIVRQSRCRSNDPDLMPRFNSTSKQCTGICQEGNVIRSPDCKSYKECISDNLKAYICPPGSLFDGQRCSFRKQTC